ncbi:helix-turn-helix transcriptional regulator [Paenibacillus sp. N1-5-1-14]|uniref:helix-turn-helix domain-containing protein n=1 Tax=Paenibacillus radicibacter TaxID=2972488 RepID=UPI00215960A1|nr:helix-turn-helix transcriptional regulator [Paenibacillus radicibacter]MCR8641727.1 helix-turn-helix transcriptional regulator [Paenibacillus radicibacter]
MINEQSYSGIGRQLHITPQQFSDWIKKRRPIPQERLQSLANYFGVDGTVFVDSNNFAEPLTPVKKVDVHILLLELKVAQFEEDGVDDEDIKPFREKKQNLLKERTRQHQLAKMNALLQLNDERINRLLDYVIFELESERVEELEMKLNKEEEQR